ncbi:MAG: tetratricopeptide repeat protein, partial [Rhodothermales bacterium]
HALYELGLVQYDLRLWSDANASFSRLIDDYRTSDLVGEALRQRGYTAIALADFDEALRDFDRAIDLEAAPQQLKEEIIFQKAWLLYRTENYAESAPAFYDLYEQNPSSSKAGEALFWAAESFFQLDQLDRATRLFRHYLRDFDGGVNVDAAHYALGWTYFKRGRYEDAARELRIFLDTYRDESSAYVTDARLRLADSYYALKRYGEAIRIYQREADDGEDYALYQIGQAFNNAGNSSEAIAAFRRLLQENPESHWREEAQYTLGAIYFQNQDYEQAIAQFESLIDQFPRDPLAAKAQYSIGDALFNDGRLADAVEAYTKVLDRYSNSPFVSDAASGIQYALTGLEDNEAADTFIEDFVARHPNSPIVAELRFRQAEVNYQSGRTDEALVGFQAFLRTHGDSPLRGDAYYYLGMLYAEREQAAEAESALAQVLSLTVRSAHRPDAARALGRLFLDQERYREALDMYRQLEQMQPDDSLLAAEARYGQSQALLGLGRPEEAERLLRDTADGSGDSSESIHALLGLARIYDQDGRTGEAALLYRQVVDRSREEPGAEALYHLGDMLLRVGDAPGAIEELSRMPVLYAGYADWLAQGYLLQARAFRNLGQDGDASRLYDRIIEDYRGTKYAEQAAREKATL